MSCQNQPEGVTLPERLSKYLTEDPEDRLRGYIVRRLGDPLRPRTGDGRIRVTPLLLVLGIVALVVVGIFFFFSYALP